MLRLRPRISMSPGTEYLLPVAERQLELLFGQLAALGLPAGARSWAGVIDGTTVFARVWRAGDVEGALVILSSAGVFLVSRAGDGGSTHILAYATQDVDGQEPVAQEVGSGLDLVQSTLAGARLFGVISTTTDVSVYEFRGVAATPAHEGKTATYDVPSALPFLSATGLYVFHAGAHRVTVMDVEAETGAEEVLADEADVSSSVGGRDIYADVGFAQLRIERVGGFDPTLAPVDAVAYLTKHTAPGVWSDVALFTSSDTEGEVLGTPTYYPRLLEIIQPRYRSNGFHRNGVGVTGTTTITVVNESTVDLTVDPDVTGVTVRVYRDTTLLDTLTLAFDAPASFAGNPGSSTSAVHVSEDGQVALVEVFARHQEGVTVRSATAVYLVDGSTVTAVPDATAALGVTRDGATVGFLRDGDAVFWRFADAVWSEVAEVLVDGTPTDGAYWMNPVTGAVCIQMADDELVVYRPDGTTSALGAPAFTHAMLSIQPGIDIARERI